MVTGCACEARYYSSQHHKDHLAAKIDILKHFRVSGMGIMAAIGMMVGGAVVNALAFTGGNNYLFSLIGGKSAEAEKERKRHDLAIEELQRAQVKYQHKRQLRLDYLK